MKLVASLLVERIHGESSRYWPPGAKRLIVIVSHDRGEDDTLVARGIDPDSGEGRLVFETMLPRTRLGAFVKALVDGDPRAVQGSSTHLLDANEAAPVAGPDPHHRARAIALALAAAIDSDTELVDAIETAASLPALDKGT